TSSSSRKRSSADSRVSTPIWMRKAGVEAPAFFVQARCELPGANFGVACDHCIGRPDDAGQADVPVASL
ncbi:hypothetical protein, partial [Klebsiella pneumoniae]|uniref:hypothetical protein n=1 Tax=Klebsiella pneumoniae TaxID=573 RepID=UPI001953F6F2